MTDHHTFTSTIRFCGLINPLPLPNSGMRPRYGCTVNADDVPTELHGHVTRKPISRQYTELRPDLAGSVWCHLTQPRPPRLVLTDGMDAIEQMHRLVRVAESTNIKPDLLMNGIPATLAVQPVEWIDAAYHKPAPEQVKRLTILAVQFAYDDLVKRFDELQREYFA